MIQQADTTINVGSEIGALRSLLIHSPDSGLGRVVPSKAQDWLFEDIVHLDSMRKNEYDYYVKLLLYFLDPDKIKGKLKDIDAKENDRDFFKPDNAAFYASNKVIEIQTLLADILENEDVRSRLVASVCAIEACTYVTQQKLIATAPADLAKIFIAGSLNASEMIFAPIPNLIFSRDLGVVVNDHILLNRPTKKARSRETLLMRYIFFNHPLFEAYRDKIIEIPESRQLFLRPGEASDEKNTIEGGDLMMVTPNHLIIGCSERTSVSGANEAMKLLFEKGVVQKITIVKIPQKRDYMHLDTVMTQVKRNVWVLLRSLSSTETEPLQNDAVAWFSDKKSKDKTEIVQFRQDKKPKTFANLEALLDNISRKDLGSTVPTQFIYSGNDEFPFDAREQWTDSCNLLALREGVVLGYDRNDKTVGAFKDKGFKVINVKELLKKLESAELKTEEMKDTLILMPSAELSRARGGFHCMSMPLEREALG